MLKSFRMNRQHFSTSLVVYNSPFPAGSYMCSSLYYSESLHPHTITTFHTASGENLMKVYGKLGEPVNEATSWFLSREQLFWCLTNVVPFTTDIFNFPRLRHPYMPSHWLTLIQLENPHRKWISTSIWLQWLCNQLVAYRKHILYNDNETEVWIGLS